MTKEVTQPLLASKKKLKRDGKENENRWWQTSPSRLIKYIYWAKMRKKAVNSDLANLTSNNCRA